MRFRIVTKAENESRSGLSLETNASLYESKVASTISEGADATMSDVSLMNQSLAMDRTISPEQLADVPVYALMNGSWLAVGVGPDVHVFDIGSEYRYSACISLHGEQKVVAMSCIPHSNFIVLVHESGEVSIGLPSGESAMMKLFDKNMSNASISFNEDPNNLIMCVTEQSGWVHFVRISFLVTPSMPIEQCMQAVLAGMTRVGRPLHLENHFVTYFYSNWLAIPTAANNMLKCISVPLRDDTVPAVEPIVALHHDALVARVVGNQLAVLSSKNALIFYDLTLCAIGSRSLAIESDPGAKVVDFQFLDVDPAGFLEDDVKGVFLVKNEHGHSIQIRADNTNVMYSMPAGERIIAMPKTKPGDDGNIICVEPFGLSRPQAVAIQIVYEAQPSMRLKRLLDSARFDDAEVFASKYHLDIQQVQVARIQYLLRQPQLSPELYAQLLKYLKQIDDNTAADFCVMALNTSSNYDQIVGLLEFADSLKVTDDSTVTALATYRYELASFRMLFGPSTANFSSSSVWPCFLNDQSHDAYFEEFCRKGEIAKARVVWNRYPDQVHELLKDLDGVKKVLMAFGQCISADPDRSVEVAEFAETDLFPYLLFEAEDKEKYGDDLIRFVIDTTKSLESRQIAKFPENALRFARCLRKAFHRVDMQTISPIEQGMLAFVMSNLQMDSTNEEIPAGELNIIIHNLQKMCHLQRVYNCKMSYADFSTKSVEAIALHLLDRVRSSSDVAQYIRDVAFAYINENFLDKDLTLWAYIREQAEGGTSFESVCLKVSESIANAGVRCQALTGIARNASIPWSKNLEKHVEKMLQASDVERTLLNQLRHECVMALIGQICVAYQIPQDCRPLLQNETVFSAMLTHLFRNEEKDITTKLADAQKLVDLVKELDTNFKFEQADVFRYYAHVILRGLNERNEEELMERFAELFRSIKSSEVRSGVAEEISVLLSSKISNGISSTTIATNRLVLVQFHLRYIQRFLPDTDEYRSLTRQLRNVMQLHDSYNIEADLTVQQCNLDQLQVVQEFLVDKGEDVLDQAISLGHLLCLPYGDLFRALITHHLSHGEIGLVMADLRAFAELEKHPQRSHLKLALDAVTVALRALSASIAESKSNNTEVDVGSIIEILSAFHEFIPVFVDWSLRLEDLIHQPFVRWYTSAFTQIARYVQLCDRILECCDNHPEAGDTTANTKKGDSFYQVHFDNDCFLPSKEGTIFESSTVLSALASVAQTVIPGEIFESEIVRETAYEDYLERWNELFNTLGLQNLLLLETHARVFASTLPFFEKTVISNMQQLIVGAEQKILVHSPPDYWLAIHLIRLLPMDAVRQAIQELRKPLMSKRNIRITLNLLAVGRFALTLIDDNSMDKMLDGWYEQSKWKKRFGKLGVSIASDKMRSEFIAETLQSFVTALVPASVVKEYCESFHFKTPEVLLQYASILCRQASAESSEPGEEKREHCESLLTMAEQALRLVEHPPADAPYDALITLIHQLCPYSYETIGLLVKQLKTWSAKQKAATGNEPAQWSKIEDFLVMLEFLRLVKRTNGYTREETIWYTNRKNVDRRVEQTGLPVPQLPATSFTQSVVAQNTSGAIGTSTVSNGGTAGMLALLSDHRREVEQEFPPTAAQRLPFHAFYIEDNREKRDILLPIMRSEIDVVNIKNWIDLSDVTKRFSRTFLQGLAITEKLNAAVVYDRDLDSEEKERIVQLAAGATNPDAVLHTITGRINQLPLSPAKLTALRLVKLITASWVANSDSFASAVTDKIHSGIEVNDRTLSNIETDCELQRNGLLNTSTAQMSPDGVQIISHILTECVAWDDYDDIDRKFTMVENIAKYHAVDLNELYLQLLEEWLSGSPDGAGAYSDPDATLDFSAAETNAQEEDDELVLSVPYLDASVTRIVMMLRKANAVDKARYLVTKFSEESTSCTAKLRIVCCLLRFLDDEQLRALFNISRVSLCERLSSILQHRCITISRVDVDFNSPDLFRVLLSAQSQYRQTAEIGHLLACAVVDHNLQEIGVIAKVAQRLHSLRLKRHLLALLKYARRLPDIRQMPSVGTYYARLFEWLVGEVDKDQTEFRSTIVALVYFLLGCPVEGRTNFNQAKQQLASAKLNIAHTLVSIAASATAHPELDVSTADMRIEWTNVAGAN